MSFEIIENLKPRLAKLQENVFRLLAYSKTRLQSSTVAISNTSQIVVVTFDKFLRVFSGIVGRRLEAGLRPGSARRLD
jgi:hypothetical protein